MILLVTILPADSTGQRSDSQRVAIKNADYDSWTSQDKFLHGSASAVIEGVSFYVYSHRLNNPEISGRIYAISFTAAIGLGKEIYDKKRKGIFSWKDLFWDGVGIAVGYFAFVYDY